MTLIAPRIQWPTLDTELPWSFSKPLFWDSHSHGLPSDPHRLFWHWDEGWAKSPPTKASRNPGSELGWAGSICANLVVSSSFLSFCPFPHLDLGCINTCQPLRFCEITVLYRLRSALRPLPGKCCRNVKHPYGWPYHWQRNLKSDPFVWLPESHCCIIHDSLLFFRRLILLPSPLRPHTAFIIWILYSELNHTVLCSGQ